MQLHAGRSIAALEAALRMIEGMEVEQEEGMTEEVGGWVDALHSLRLLTLLIGGVGLVVAAGGGGGAGDGFKQESGLVVGIARRARKHQVAAAGDGRHGSVSCS